MLPTGHQFPRPLRRGRPSAPLVSPTSARGRPALAREPACRPDRTKRGGEGEAHANHFLPRPPALLKFPMRLLIIEDDREAVSYLVKAFREAGHVADQALDGLDGYALAREGAYDVLIVDRMLPKLDGLSLIRSLREQGVETPVLILSALGQVDDRVKGLRAGGDDYVSKPYAFSELLARVEVLSGRRAAARSAEATIYRVGDLE